MIKFAEKIKEYRERKLLTQTELAKNLGVGVVSISRWESGKYEPTMSMKRKLKVLFIEAGMNIEN